MTFRVAVRGDTGWLGQLDDGGHPYTYGMPLKWWNGSAWQTVTNYDYVKLWDGVSWVPFSDKKLVTVGTPWQGSTTVANTMITHDFTYPAGVPFVVGASLGAGSAPTPDDIVIPEVTVGYPYSPTFVSLAFGYGNGATQYGCEDLWQAPVVTQPMDNLVVATTLRTDDQNPLTPPNRWRFPDEAAALPPGSTGSAYIAVPMGIQGVTKVSQFAYTNCRIISGSDNQRYYPGLPNLPGRAGLLIRVCAVYGGLSASTGMPGTIPTPTGYTQLWTGTQTTAGTIRSSYLLGDIRMSIFSKLVAADESIDPLVFTLGSSSSNGESVQSTFLLI